MPVSLSAACASDAQVLALAGWLESHGAELSTALEIGGCGVPAKAATRRGIYVRSDGILGVGDVAARVPLALLMTRSGAENEPSLDQDTHLGSTNLMSLFLLSQRENGRFWSPYVRSLPRHVTSTLTWSTEELSELQASELAEHAAMRTRAVTRHHAHVVRTHQSLTLPEWSWALSTVWARSHTVDLGTKGRPTELRAPAACASMRRGAICMACTRQRGLPAGSLRSAGAVRRRIEC